MQLKIKPYQLKFKRPFSIAAGTRNATSVVYIELNHEGITGYGEAAMPPYLGETTESVVLFLQKVQLKNINSIDDIENFMLYLNTIDTGNTAAKAAIDIALHDYLGKKTGKSVSEMYGIPMKPVKTTYTISIGTGKEVVEKVNEAGNFDIYKIKLGGEKDREMIEAFLSISNKKFCVDVNQGWKDENYAIETSLWLQEMGALLIEQPFPKEMIAETKKLQSKCLLPIIADEACKRIEDIDKIKNAYRGINIKLMKSTGINEAFRMIKKAKNENLKVLIGCMSESSCGVSAAAHLAPLCDWVDLDGPCLINNDPFNGINIKNGVIYQNNSPGISAIPNKLYIQ
jgi:L-Ala-D/L-Glu epimerase